VRAFLRPQDRLVACELEPNAAAALARNLDRDRRLKVIPIDGWTALNAYVPPPERRGLVLVDPPYENEDEFARLAHGLEAAHRKWANGIVMVWYPIKDRSAPDALARRLRRAGIPKLLRTEINVAASRDDNRLRGCGLVFVNPPWTLASDLAVLLPPLTAILSGGGRGQHRTEWLTTET
jgi:23S rRNA (adenine2030-N6)-methyltransferase